MSVALLLAGITGLASEVIAAPAGHDQPHAAPGSSLPTVLLLALAPLCAVVIRRRGWHRLADAPARREVAPPVVSLALVLLMLMLGTLGAQVAMRVAGLSLEAGRAAPTSSLDDHAQVALGAYAGQTLAALLYVALAWAGRGAAPGRAGPTRAVLVGLAALALWWPVVNAVGWGAAALRGWLGGPVPDPVAHETLRLLVDAPRGGWFVVLVGLVIVAAPVLEELLYRGLLQESLRRLGLPAWPAIIAVSVVFAGMHWTAAEPPAVVGLAVLSLGFGWAYERTGRLAAPIAMHVAFNAGNLLVALTLQT